MYPARGVTFLSCVTARNDDDTDRREFCLHDRGESRLSADKNFPTGDLDFRSIQYTIGVGVVVFDHVQSPRVRSTISSDLEVIGLSFIVSKGGNAANPNLVLA